jgi:hypothetical protein
VADTGAPTDPTETEPETETSAAAPGPVEGSEGEAIDGTETSDGEKQPTKVLTAIRERSPAVVIGGLALALVVGLLAGAAVGVKFEQGRAKDDIKRIRKHAAAAKKQQATTGPTTRVIGVVTKADGKTVTVALNKTARKQITVDPSTVIELTGPGRAADLAVGSHVVWKNTAGTKDTAAEVIALPTYARTGVVLTAVTPTSMTYNTPKGKLDVDTSKADIQSVTAGRPSDLTTGTPVLVQARQTADKKLTAVEVIVLQKDTKFGQKG